MWYKKRFLSAKRKKNKRNTNEKKQQKAKKSNNERIKKHRNQNLFYTSLIIRIPQKIKIK